MHRTSQPLGVLLAVLLIWINTAEAVPTPQVRMTSGYVVRKQVELFGTGTEVKVTRVGGKKLSGSILTVEADFFELSSGNNQHSIQVAYSEVAEFIVTRAIFRESDNASALQARRVIQGLGIGRLIEVRTLDNKLGGRIQVTAQDHFEILLTGKSMLADIAYADLRELQPQPIKVTRKGTGISTSTKVFAGFIVFLIVGLPLQCGLRKNCQF